MELKRYVMLKNGMIINEHRPDTYRNKGFEYVESRTNNISWWRCFDDKDVVKTSDDILDFVEVGDLVEDTYGVTAMVVAFGLNGEDGDERVFKCCYVDVLYEDVKAIWKRQGDTMKRYEVQS